MVRKATRAQPAAIRRARDVERKGVVVAGLPAGGSPATADYSTNAPLGDALAFDYHDLSADTRVVGNLPYNISSPILFMLLDLAARPWAG